MNFVSNLINAAASIVLSLIIANYGIEEFYSYLQKEAIRKVHFGLPSLSKMTNELICKQLNKKMDLIPYNKGTCSKSKEGRRMNNLEIKEKI